MASILRSPPAGQAPQSAQPARADKTLYSLQALRFIAAALVVISHIRNEVGLTPFGSSGVDIFFVISGFIIYYVTRDGAPQFFTRRLIRIVPLYWLGTLALAAIALKAPGMLKHTSLDASRLLGSLFFIPVWNESIQYHMPLLTLGWSLNYEILFYLVFFIALKISHQHRLLISSLLLVSLTALHPYAAPESALAFWSDAYVVEFIYGMLLAQILSSTRFIEHARLPMMAAMAGLVLYTWALLPDTGLVTQEMALDKWVRVVVIGLPSTALVVLTLACEPARQGHHRLPGRAVLPHLHLPHLRDGGRQTPGRTAVQPACLHGDRVRRHADGGHRGVRAVRETGARLPEPPPAARQGRQQGQGPPPPAAGCHASGKLNGQPAVTDLQGAFPLHGRGTAPVPQLAAKFSNLVYCPWKASVTEPIGPLRCLPMMISAMPLVSASGS